MPMWLRISALVSLLWLGHAYAQTWTPDNGDGTYADPDMIRVGEDFYLTGTTMHSMPGLPILHSQRSIGPRPAPSVLLDASSMKDHDVAGLALFNRPYAWVGVERADGGLWLTQFDEQTGRTERQKLSSPRVWLRAECDFLTEQARFSSEQPGDAESFQWIETPTGELVLMSLSTHRFLRIDQHSQRIVADSPGPLPDGSDGVRWTWSLATVLSATDGARSQ